MIETPIGIWIPIFKMAHNQETTTHNIFLSYFPFWYKSDKILSYSLIQTLCFILKDIRIKFWNKKGSSKKKIPKRRVY